MATEVIYLRVDPVTKAMLVAQVEAMNKRRSPAEPEYTLQSYVMRCVEQVMSPEMLEGADAVRGVTRRRKGARK
jgi:hypothetical protein